MSESVDLLVIGGGINGAGIARDAAGRGLRVLLCEKGDLAEATSSRSGKLVHGGLRYLEHYEFRLVREALIEREVLLALAPHIIWPMRFVLPHSPGERPAWMVRLGLLLYDHLGGRTRLPPTRTLDLRKVPEGAPLRQEYRRAFEYSDCWVDDARLVLLNALDAKERGATVLTRTACISARREDGGWIAELADGRTGQRRAVRAKAIVNAAGPWVSDVITRIAGSNSSQKVRLVKGSHLVTRKFWQGDHAHLVQNHDRRVIFINPYLGDKALIGTTDIAHEGPPESVAIEEGEIDYLIAAVNRYFEHGITREDVIETFAGVRPLYDDTNENPSAVTRDYVFDLDTVGGAALLNVFGGKITTYRKLAEHALSKLAPYLRSKGGDWSAKAPLPGGDMPDADFDAFLASLRAEYAFLPQPLASHYGRLYGTRARQLLGAARSLDDLGTRFGPLLYEREANYLRQHEWAETVEDVLWRRTKHGLSLSGAQKSAFARWLEDDHVAA